MLVVHRQLRVHRDGAVWRRRPLPAAAGPAPAAREHGAPVPATAGSGHALPARQLHLPHGPEAAEPAAHRRLAADTQSGRSVMATRGRLVKIRE